MKINKIRIIVLIVLMIFVNIDLLQAGVDNHDYTGESILYLLSPLGRSEYNNCGVADLKGVKVNVLTLRTKVLFFESMEKIYSDPESLLPLKIERSVSKPWSKEYITEEYDQEKFTVAIRKFKNKKLVSEKIIKAKEPIQNVILFLFYLRRYPDLTIGWNFTARVPAEVKSELVSIKLELVSIDEITVPAGKFQAYHFKSVPNTFEIWVNKNNPRVPLKIKSHGIIDYSILMKGYRRDNI